MGSLWITITGADDDTRRRAVDALHDAGIDVERAWIDDRTPRRHPHPGRRRTQRAPRPRGRDPRRRSRSGVRLDWPPLALHPRRMVDRRGCRLRAARPVRRRRPWSRACRRKPRKEDSAE